MEVLEVLESNDKTENVVLGDKSERFQYIQNIQYLQNHKLSLGKHEIHLHYGYALWGAG